MCTYKSISKVSLFRFENVTNIEFPAHYCNCEYGMTQTNILPSFPPFFQNEKSNINIYGLYNKVRNTRVSYVFRTIKVDGRRHLLKQTRWRCIFSCICFVMPIIDKICAPVHWLCISLNKLNIDFMIFNIFKKYGFSVHYFQWKFYNLDQFMRIFLKRSYIIETSNTFINAYKIVSCWMKMHSFIFKN